MGQTNGLRYGRKPRRFNPRVPHFSALRLKFGLAQVQAPPSVDWTAALPASLGMMENDRLGDCADAGFFHAMQLWTANAAGAMLTVPDGTVQQLYSDNAGYVPGNPSTDNGTDLQSLLTYLATTGALMPDGTREKIVAFVEVDPQNANDLNLVTAECGLIYLGFNVPQYLESLEAPGSLWDVQTANANIVGGHCVVSGKYGTDGNRGIISWGSPGYAMTPAFWAANVDEAYGIITQRFVEASGKTPWGIALADWEEQMQAIKEQGT
jgi:hypothetical protein